MIMIIRFDDDSSYRNAIYNFFSVLNKIRIIRNETNRTESTTAHSSFFVFCFHHCSISIETNKIKKKNVFQMKDGCCSMVDQRTTTLSTFMISESI